MSRAVLLIDLQNDYYPGGAFPLWNTAATTAQIVAMVAAAQAAGDLIIHVQHIADPSAGLAPFFNAGTPGALIHEAVLAAAPEAAVVVKHYADSFVDTTLATLLQEHQIDSLLVAGMMTQNCVTHTAISPSAEGYDVAILTDCCTTVNELLHQIALHAVSTRMQLTDASTVYGIDPASV